MIHKLKIHPEYFKAAKLGLKKGEIRYNDRKFKVGDMVILQEFEPMTETYTGQELTVKIDHIVIAGRVAGIKPGYVFFSFTVVKKVMPI